MTTALLDGHPVRAAKLPAWLATARRAAIVLLILAFSVASITFVRVFVFEYFHGDPRPLQELVRHVAGALGT